MEDLGTVELKVGDDHTVLLGSLATAGYLWTATVEGAKEAATVSEAPSVASEATEHPRRGESLEEAFIVRAVAPGRAVLRFVQRRSWEEGSPAKEATLHVTVHQT